MKSLTPTLHRSLQPSNISIVMEILLVISLKAQRLSCVGRRGWGKAKYDFFIYDKPKKLFDDYWRHLFIQDIFLGWCCKYFQYHYSFHFGFYLEGPAPPFLACTWPSGALLVSSRASLGAVSSLTPHLSRGPGSSETRGHGGLLPGTPTSVKHIYLYASSLNKINLTCFSVNEEKSPTGEWLFVYVHWPQTE